MFQTCSNFNQYQSKGICVGFAVFSLRPLRVRFQNYSIFSHFLVHNTESGTKDKFHNIYLCSHLLHPTMNIFLVFLFSDLMYRFFFVTFYYLNGLFTNFNDVNHHKPSKYMCLGLADFTLSARILIVRSTI